MRVLKSESLPVRPAALPSWRPRAQVRLLAAFALGLLIGATILAPGRAAASPGDIVVADLSAFDGGGLIGVDPANGARTTVSANGAPAGQPPFVIPTGVVFERGGDILVGDQGAFGDSGGVLRVDPASGTRSTVSKNSAPFGEPFFRVGGVAVERDGDILVTDIGGFDIGNPDGRVIRVDPTSGRRTLVSGPASSGPDLVNPVGVALDRGGDILVSDSAFGAGGSVKRIDSVTGKRTSVSRNDAPPGEPAFHNPSGIAVARDGAIFVAEPGLGAILRVNPDTGTRTVLSDEAATFGSPVGLALAPDGGVLVADPQAFGGNGGVIRIDPVTGEPTAVSANTSPFGEPFFADPTQIAVEPPPPRCRGLRATRVGTERADQIRGSKRRDVIVAFGGADRVRGLGGKDVLCGGDGNDRLSGGAGDDQLRGEQGADRLVGGKGRDRLSGGPGKDRSRQ